MAISRPSPPLPFCIRCNEIFIVKLALLSPLFRALIVTVSSTVPRHSPHHRALFSLVPTNDRATAVLNHPDNAHHISVVSDDRKPGKTLYGLDIGLHIGSKSRYTLATIGRCGDIIVEGLAISRIQCSFEINEDNKEEIML
ncbi:hypothetical protein CC80DRAFT_552896 [Byssothecium circinans]|uniref:Uncharacterized protein n=1 Tax=Byssothecium circinans TaxID=147558 RepID=A0A6A5TI42_9PLEO|nr:hypothetical protein CC80DRAFT_552896 [Byssothecium circinans]